MWNLLSLLVISQCIFCHGFDIKKEYLIEQPSLGPKFPGSYPDFNILNDESYEVEDDEFSDTHLPQEKRYTDEELETYEKKAENPLNFTQVPPAVKYLSRTEPFYVLRCTVQQCDTLNIICSDNDYINNEMGYNKPRISLRGPVSERKCIGEMKITHRQVENWFNSFQCYCQAWKNNPANGEPFTKRTNKTDIFIASMYRSFEKSPESLKTNVGKSVSLECISPRGKPTPIIAWMKVGKGVMHPTGDSRVRIINEVHQRLPQATNETLALDYPLQKEDETKSVRSRLVIDRATKEDEGHYFCQAYNLDGTVNSTISSLQIIDNKIKIDDWKPKDEINGTWSQWSIWESDCSDNKTGNICYQKRKRVCMLGESSLLSEEKVSCTETGMNVELETRACKVSKDETTEALTLSDCKIDLKQISVIPGKRTMLQDLPETETIREDVVLYLGLSLAVILFILASATAIYMLIKAGKCFCLQKTTVLQKNILDKFHSHSAYNPQTAFHTNGSTLDTKNVDSSFIVSLRHSNSLNHFEKSQDSRSYYDNKTLRVLPNQKYSSYYFKTQPTDSFIGDVDGKGPQANYHSTSYTQLFSRDNDADVADGYLQSRPPFSEGIQLPRSYLLERDEIAGQLSEDLEEQQMTVQASSDESKTLESYRQRAKTFSPSNNEGCLIQGNQEKPPLPRKEREKRLTVNRVQSKNLRPNSVKI